MTIAFVTGSRADQGALAGVAAALWRIHQNEPDTSWLAGVDYWWLDVYPPREDTDQPLNSAHGAANACTRASTEIARKHITWVILHGDRYEILGAATAAFLLGLPVVHLGGGDVTEGSQDNSIRDAISSLSHLHFATCKESARRLIRMGIDPTRVYDVGDPGIDIFFDGTAFPSKGELTKKLNLPPDYFLIAYHPNTLGDTYAEVKILEDAIQRACKRLPNVHFVLLDPNMDAGHAVIRDTFSNLEGPQVSYRTDLPRHLYLSLLKNALALVGNSSAAFYEAPYLGTPVITFGDRQLGRCASPNHIGRCFDASGLVQKMVEVVKNPPERVISHPYGDGRAGDRIAQILQKTNPKALLKKKFY